MNKAIRLHTVAAPDQAADAPSRVILVPVSSIHFVHAADGDVKHTLVYMMQNGLPFHVSESFDEIDQLINGEWPK